MTARVFRFCALTIALLLALAAASAVAQDGPTSARVAALDAHVDTLRTWLDNGAPWDDEAPRNTALAYLTEMRDLLILPACATLEGQLRSREMPQSAEEFETLCLRLQAYRVLTGMLEPDVQLIRRTLAAQMTRLATDGNEPNDEQAARIEVHLALVADIMNTARRVARAVAPGGRPDSSAMYRAELTLRPDSWANLVYRRLIEDLTPQVGEVTVASLLEGMPGAALFSGDRAFPALLTQDGYDNTLRAAMDDAAAGILARVEAAGVRTNRITLRGLIDIFRALFSADVRSGWNQLILGIRAEPAGETLDEAAALFGQLGDPAASPLRSLLWTIWESRSVMVDGDERFSVTPDGQPGTWIPAVTGVFHRAHKALAAVLEDAGGAVPRGQRIRAWLRAGHLRPLWAVLDSADVDLGSALEAADRDYAHQLHAMLLRIVQAGITALQREAAAELDAAWKADVVGLAERLAGQYPFRADGQTDAALADVVELWHPRTGRVARTLELAGQLQDSVQVPLGSGHRAARLALVWLQGLLFEQDPPGVTLMIEVSELTAGDEITLVSGKYTVELHKLQPDFTGVRRLHLIWSPAEGNGRAAIRIRRGGKTYVAEGAGNWALLRLFAASARDRISNQRELHTFTLKPEANGNGNGEAGSIEFAIVCVYPGRRARPLEPAAFDGISLLDRLTSPSSDD